MGTCRCAILNVLSGALARDLLDRHLLETRTDGMGRTVYLCEESEIEWLEERRLGGHEDDVTVLRRLEH